MKPIATAVAFAAVLSYGALSYGTGAQAASTGAEVQAAVADNTVQGNMDASGAYAEFYAADGTIKGKDYAGKWSIDGDMMCFEYQDTPKACYGVEVAGDQVRWLKDGKSTGTGTIVKGNANGF